MLVSMCLFFVISRAFSVESIRLVAQPDDAINEPGKPSLFKCIFDDEPAQCLWMKDGMLIADDATTYRLVGQKHFYDCSLQVSLPETSVNHTFQCVSPETPRVRSAKSRVATLFAADAVTDELISPLPLVQQDLIIDNLVHQSTPILLVHPTDRTVRANGTVTLRCEFDQEPPGCVWFRDDNPLYFRNDARYTVANETSGDCSLRIENVTADAEGSYRCESPETSALTSVRSDAARLAVTRPPTLVSIIHDGLDYTNGEIRPQKEAVNVTCVVKGCHPKPKMSWKFRNETILVEADEVLEGGESFPDSYVATISIAIGSDARESLECAVDHPASEERTEVSVRIVVVQEQRQPVIERDGTVLRHGETALIPEGQWMQLRCLSPRSLCRTVNLSWFLGDLDNSTVLTNYTCVPNSEDGRGDAIGDLSAVPLDDVDLYCQAKHAHLGYLLEAKVAVKVFSPLTTVVVRFDSRDGDELAAMANATVNLTCDADGNLPTKYGWFFKPHGQEEWEEFFGERKVSVRVTERGNYSCRANNGYDPRWFASRNEVHLRLKEAVTSVEASFAEFPDRQGSIPKDGEVTAACVSNGDPPVTFLWYSRLNDSTPWRLMNTSNGNNVTNMHTVSVASEGWYKCAAHNEASFGIHVDSDQLFVTISSQQRRRSSSSVIPSSAVLVFLMSCLTMSTAS